MVVLVRFRVDIERQCKLSITLQSCTLIVTAETLPGIAFARLGRVTLHLLFQMLTVAGNEDLVQTWLVFLASRRSVTLFLTRMTTCLLRLAASLLACRTGLFAFTRSVTLFATEVGTTFELLPTGFATSGVLEPARLILQQLFPTHTRLGYQVRTFGTWDVISVAIVWYGWMPARFWTLAIKSAWWWFGSAWQWRLKCRPRTMATELLEYSFSTAAAWSFMAELRAGMVAALQQPTTGPCTYMFSLNVVLKRSRGAQWSQLAFDGLSFRCLPLAWTTTLAAFMPSAIECCFAGSHTLWLLFMTLMTDCGCLHSSAATSNRYRQEAWHASVRVADLLA